jgi:hypothetical protein
MMLVRAHTIGALAGLVAVGGYLGSCAPKTRDIGVTAPAPAALGGESSIASRNANPTLDASQHPPAPQGTENPKPTLESVAVDYRAVRARLKGHDTNLSFHLVDDLPEAIGFAPLGSDSLLVAGHCEGPLPLLIENNQLRFLPELADGAQRKRVFTCVSSIGGTWPDNTWAAVSSASDAGPSSSDVYQWTPGQGWVLKHEHDPWVFELLPWRGNMVFLSKCQACAVPQTPQLVVRSSSGKWLKQAQPAGCQPPGETVAPAWVHAGGLSFFGSECDPIGNAPEGGTALLLETWTSSGRTTLQRIPLPKGHKELPSLVLSKAGWVALLPSPDKAPSRLARFDKKGWTTVTELPAKFTALSAPASGNLWGTVDGYLLSWSDPDFAITELPRDPKYAGISWESVWERGPKDIWLIGSKGSEPARYLLFNTADGKVAQAFPSEAERDKSRSPSKDEDESDKPVTCANPFADFLKLTPFQLGFDTTIEMSPKEARRTLQAVLTRHPEYRHLEFVEHRCYGENCIGAVVRNVQEAVLLRKELDATLRTIVKIDTSSGGPPVTWLLSDDNPRCVPPPETTPFPLPR